MQLDRRRAFHGYRQGLHDHYKTIDWDKLKHLRPEPESTTTAPATAAEEKPEVTLSRRPKRNALISHLAPVPAVSRTFPEHEGTVSGPLNSHDAMLDIFEGLLNSKGLKWQPDDKTPDQFEQLAEIVALPQKEKSGATLSRINEASGSKRKSADADTGSGANTGTKKRKKVKAVNTVPEHGEEEEDVFSGVGVGLDGTSSDYVVDSVAGSSSQGI